MKSLNFVRILLVALAYGGVVRAQNPTAYVPRVPTPGAETGLCTPPPGGICSTTSQTSYVVSFSDPFPISGAN